MVVWRIAQILNKKDLSFGAGPTKTGSALAVSVCCMLTKIIFYAQQTKRSGKQCTNFQLSWNDTQGWIYDCRFYNHKCCKNKQVWLDACTVEQTRFQDFLKSIGLILEFNSRSLNYSMPKEGSSGVIGERNSMRSTDMKYQFNMIVPFVIK